MRGAGGSILIVIGSVLALGACAGVLGIPDEVSSLAAEAASDAPIFDAAPDTVPAEAGADAAPDAPPEIDAGPLCDPAKDFLAPTLVMTLSKNGTEGSSRLTEDEKIIYFAQQVPGASTYDLYTASRTVLTDSFQAPVPVPGLVNTAANHEYQPNVTANGLTIFFERQDSITEDSDIFMATRTTPTGPFGTATRVPGNVNGSGIRYDAKVFVRGDGSRFYYSSLMSGHTDIFVAEKQGTDWMVTAVQGINLPAYDEYSPVVSKDELTIFFSSQRPIPGGAMPGFNVWVAKRTSTALPFDEPTPVPAINSDQFEAPDWLSVDGCRLYMGSKRLLPDQSKQGIYVAKRPL